jgi:hypothetical protein
MLPNDLLLAKLVEKAREDIIKNTKKRVKQKHTEHRYFSELVNWILIAFVGLEYALLAGIAFGLGYALTQKLLG